VSPTETDTNTAGSVREGEVVAGKYRVGRLLGSGGMGLVVAAHHLVLDERVALKFLLPGATSNPELVGRFMREARAAAKIKSEHVARVTDVGQLDDGSPYMVMEYLEGSDLAAYLAREGPLPVEKAVDFVLQACEALAEAHGLGIIHRDLKPANLFCVQRGDDHLVIKVLDFGISKLAAIDTVNHSLTQTSSLMGSPAYMSPEQMQSAKTVDARADIWSLGIILFELLTGNPPFDSPLVTELVFKIATEPAPLLRSVRPDIPAGMERVVARCLLRDRAARYQSVAALAVALREFGTPSAATSVERILRTMRRAGVRDADFDAEAPTDLAIQLPKPPVAPPPALLGVGSSAGAAPSTLGASPSEPGVFGPSSVYVQPTFVSHEARSGWSRGALALLAVVGLVGGGVAVRGMLATRQSSATPPADVLPSASVTVVPTADVDASASPSPRPPLPPLGEAAPPPTSSAATARIPTPTRPKNPPPTLAPPVNCDPPTWQDETGHVHIKKGCR
jgi:serine/threonine-protein kinase